MDQQIVTAKKIIDASDAVIVSASNGLSIAEGYNIFADDKNFRAYFNDFRSLYGVSSLIQGVFAQLPKADHQVFMNKVHQMMIDDYQPSEPFANLKNILSDKDYFVVTSNADTHFQLNGFDPKRIFEIEGNFDGLEMNSAQWEEQQNRFEQFVTNNQDKQLVQLELGIGARNNMIKAPLMNLVAQHASWSFITLNMPKEINVPEEISSQSISLPGDIGQTFKNLLTVGEN